MTWAGTGNTQADRNHTTSYESRCSHLTSIELFDIAFNKKPNYHTKSLLQSQNIINNARMKATKLVIVIVIKLKFGKIF